MDMKTREMLSETAMKIVVRWPMLLTSLRRFQAAPAMAMQEVVDRYCGLEGHAGRESWTPR